MKKNKRKSPVKWSEEDLNWLKENYIKLGPIECAKILNRTPESVTSCANRNLNLVTENSWTPEEDIILLENYKQLGPTKCQALLNRSRGGIRSRAKILNITYGIPQRRWTQEDKNYLLNNWNKYSLEELSKKLDRTVVSISTKERSLGLNRSNYYSEEDILYLQENYIKLGAEECAKTLDRPIQSIRTIVSKFKIAKPKKLTQEIVDERISKLDIELLEPFNGCVDNKHKFKCQCGKEFFAVLDKIFSGHTQRCGNCKLRRNGIYTSQEALNLHQDLILAGFNTKESDHNYKDIDGKYIDIVIHYPEFKIAIEYDGWYWHKDKIEQDNIRHQEIINNGSRLLVIRCRNKRPNIKTIISKIRKLENDSKYELIIGKDWK